MGESKGPRSSWLLKTGVTQTSLSAVCELGACAHMCSAMGGASLRWVTVQWGSIPGVHRQGLACPDAANELGPQLSSHLSWESCGGLQTYIQSSLFHLMFDELPLPGWTLGSLRGVFSRPSLASSAHPIIPGQGLGALVSGQLCL